jgi:uncharacterized protein (TIGR03437 family)
VPGTLLADPGETAIRFEVTADPEASEETAVLEARVGENAVRESLAVSSFGPHLLAPAKITGMPATALKFAVTATGAATITATGLPSGSVFDANAGAFAWTPLAGDLGAHEISFLATDARGARAARTVVVFIGTGAPVVRQLRNLAGGGVCSPGAIAALSGWFLARGEAPLADRSGRSDSLGQTRVLVNGAYVPILSASADWVEFLCPNLPVTMPLEIAVETPSGRSSFLQTTMQETAPAILSVDSSQKSQALAIRSNTAELAALPNFRLRARPALSGELVSFWATGIECAASPRLSLILGGHPVSIDSAHPVSEIAGTCEISFRTPVDVSGDAVSLMIQTIQGNSAVSTSNRTSLAIRSSAQEADPGNWNL